MSPTSSASTPLRWPLQLPDYGDDTETVRMFPGVLEEKPRSVGRKTVKPEHQRCLFTRTRPAAFAVINESEEVGVALQLSPFLPGACRSQPHATGCRWVLLGSVFHREWAAVTVRF